MSMLVVDIRVRHAHGRDHDKHLYRLTIVNDGSGDEDTGNYDWKIGRPEFDALFVEHVDSGRVEQFARDRGCWNLSAWCST